MDIGTLSGAASPDVLRELGDALEIGVLDVDRGLVVRGWNRWLETATGRLAADAIGRPLSEVFPVMRDSVRTAFERALGGASVVLSHGLHHEPLGIPAPAGYGGFAMMQQSVRLLPTLDDEGRVTGAVALVEDVTERVAREAELRSALEHAEAANKAKAEFLAAMSHELRTPIGAIAGYADLLKDGIFGSVTTTQQEYIGRMKNVSMHLLRIVEEILTFARIDADRETVSIGAVDAVELARQALIAVEPQALKKGLQLTVDLPGEPLMMQTDGVKLRQVLINLLGNAAKFTDKGMVSLTVTSSEDGDMVNFIVRDTGPGITPEDLERIFEPFTQVKSSFNRSHEGTGLGLSVSRQFARMLGGSLTVTSELGVGSVFVAALPVGPASAAEAPEIDTAVAVPPRATVPRR